MDEHTHSAAVGMMTLIPHAVGWVIILIVEWWKDHRRKEENTRVV